MSPRTRPRQARDDRSSPTQTLRRYRIGLLAAVVVLAAVLFAAVRLLEDPARVSNLTIHNPSEFDIEVEITSPSHDGWLRLTGVPVTAATQYSDVLDPGDTWVFSFQAQGRDGGEVSIPKAQLAAAGWQLDVPQQVIDRLRAAGAPASPHH